MQEEKIGSEDVGKVEDLGLADSVKVEKGAGGGSKNLAASEKRDKAISDAHGKYVNAIEAARVAYVNAKNQANREFEEAK